MGLAMLVPGVSGGTMILVMGLYDEFIISIADVTRLRWSRRGVGFLALVGGCAVVVIATLAGTMSRIVTLHKSAMFALFIGLTLGGVPMLIRLLKRLTLSATVGIVIGLGLMIAVAWTQQDPVDKEAVRAAVAQGRLVIHHDYVRDAAAGAAGMCAMILPGISGAYLLLVLGRYETILAAISLGKDYVTTWGGEDQALEFLRVLIPVSVGALSSLILASNLLKWMLNRHPQPTVGLLLGILVGSIVGLWPFPQAAPPEEYAVGAGLALAGFMATYLLSRISR